jgi:hypothetical protein
MVQDGTGDDEREGGLVCVCRLVGLVRRYVVALRRPFGYRHGRLGRAGEIIYKVLNRRVREGGLHHVQTCVSIPAYGARRASVSQKRQS